MKHEIIIRMLEPVIHKTPLARSYSTGNIMKVLTSDNKIEEFSSSEYLARASTNNPLPIAWSKPIDFGVLSSMEHRFTYETFIDKDGYEVGIDTQNKDLKKAYEEFWCKHPNTVVNGVGHANTKNPLFNLIDTTAQTIQGLVDYDNKLRIANRIQEMSFDEKRDVMYFFGKSPVGKLDGELKMLLADFTTGLCFQGANTEKFLAVWMNASSHPDRDMRVTLRKAIELNVIQNNPKNGLESYYLGQSPIGNSIDDLIGYFKKEDALFKEFVERVVHDKEDISLEADNSLILDKAVSKGKLGVMNDGEITDLRRQAKQLKDEGFIDKGFNHHSAKVVRLMEEIEKGSKLKQEKERAAVTN